MANGVTGDRGANPAPHAGATRGTVELGVQGITPLFDGTDMMPLAGGVDESTLLSKLEEILVDRGSALTGVAERRATDSEVGARPHDDDVVPVHEGAAAMLAVARANEDGNSDWLPPTCCVDTSACGEVTGGGKHYSSNSGECQEAEMEQHGLQRDHGKSP